MPQRFELGLDTFGDVTFGATAGALLTQAHTLRDVIAEAVLAEEVGVDAFGVGEHHRRDFSISAPDVMLAAIASVRSCTAFPAISHRFAYGVQKL